MSANSPTAVARLRRLLRTHQVEPSAILAEDLETAEAEEARLARLHPVLSDFVSEVLRSELEARMGSLDVQAQILDVWGSAFDLLDAVRILSADLGREGEAVVAEWFSGSGPPKRRALGRLFWGTHLVAREVLTLLRHGYAAGALARWRAMYEIGVRAAVIDAGGDELAESFLAHEQLRHLRENRRWWTEVERNPIDELEQRARDQLAGWEDAVIARHGGEIFRRDYGWAHPYLHAHDPAYRKAFEKDRRVDGPNLTDLSRSLKGYPEKAARESYYSRASAAIHGAPRSLGEFDETNELNVWGGPTLSYLGLVVDQAAEDLAQISFTYMGPLEDSNSDEAILLALCLDQLVRVCQTTTLRIHESLATPDNPSDE